MLQAEREFRILNLIDNQGAVSVRELAELFDVTEVTVRRDLQRMESRELLRRTHGGAISTEQIAEVEHPTTYEKSGVDVDALIISPVNNRAAHTLREKAIRNEIPFLAESCPQDGAIYLGPHNFEAGRQLGIWTADYIAANFRQEPIVLVLTQHSLPNTLERSQGFINELNNRLGHDTTIISVDGNALYDQSYQVAYEALRSNPHINVIFGINDDSLLAGLQAYADLGFDLEQLLAVNIGGEGSTIFNKLMNVEAFKACVALFPEIVGRLGVDAVSYLWDGQQVGDAIYTPYRLITPENINEYYLDEKSGWKLNPQNIETLVDASWQSMPPKHQNKQISFVIHYRTHEWYQSIAQAMATRAQMLGIQFSAQDVMQDLAHEIRNLRRLIGKLAATFVEDGDTIILDSGSTTTFMSHFIDHHKNLTVITNSHDVFQKLHNRPNVKLILTGGEFDPETRSLTGRGAQLLLNELRADKLFLVAGGISDSFGISSVTMHEAEVRRTMIQSSREVIVLADHTVLDTDSNVSVTNLDVIDTLITDAGISAAQKLSLIQRGIQVISAGSV